MDVVATLRKKKFLGVRIGLMGLLLAAASFVIAACGYIAAGIDIFIVAWIVALAGFFIHLLNGRQLE